MNQIFKKIDNEESSFCVNAKFVNKSLELVVLQKDKALKCFVTEAVLNEWCNKYRMCFNDYYNVLQEYLNTLPDDINVCLNKHEFVIYRRLNRGRAKFFVSNLEEIDYNNYVENTLIAFYNENETYRNEILTLKTQQELLETKNSEYATKLQEFIDRKERDDEQLYSNFVQVLNEKKRKIQQLTELLEVFRNGRHTVKPSPSQTKRTKPKNDESPSKMLHKETISESEESSNEIDENMEVETSTDDDDNENDEDAVEDEEMVNAGISDDDFLLPKRVKNTQIEPVEVLTANSTQIESQQETVQNEKQKPTIDTQELLDMV